MGTYYIGASSAADNENYRIYRLYTDLYTILKRNGYPGIIIPWVIAQVFHETNYLKTTQGGGFNLTGIKYYPKNKKHVRFGQLRGYVKFPNLDEWAIDLRDNYLKQNKTGKGRPIDTSTDYNEYARRLKANGYYEAPMLQYTTGLQRALNKLAAATAWARNTAKIKAIEAENNKTNWPKDGELAKMKEQTDEWVAKGRPMFENPFGKLFEFKYGKEFLAGAIVFTGVIVLSNLTRR